MAWAVMTISNAEVFLATRKKVEWLHLITVFFLGGGWLLTDRAHEDRQNALVHLIPNSVALCGTGDKNA